MLRTYELSRAPGGAPLYEQLYRAIRAALPTLRDAKS